MVDNGSADGAADMVAREFPEVVLCRNRTNEGFARANNQAAARARGRYLFFLNNDTLVPPQTLGQLVDFAEAHPEVGLVGPRLCDAAGQPQVSYFRPPTLPALLHRAMLLRWSGLFRRAYRRYRRQDFDPRHTRAVEVLQGAALLIRRQTFHAAGGWDEDFTFGGEDLELSVRIGRQHPLVYLASAEITHLGRVSTRLNIGFSAPSLAAGYVRYLRKVGYSPAAILLYKLVISLDIPIRFAAKSVEYLWRCWRGDPKAEKTWLGLKGLVHFLGRGLAPFWKA